MTHRVRPSHEEPAFLRKEFRGVVITASDDPKCFEWTYFGGPCVMWQANSCAPNSSAKRVIAGARFSRAWIVRICRYSGIWRTKRVSLRRRPQILFREGLRTQANCALMWMLNILEHTTDGTT